MQIFTKKAFEFKNAAGEKVTTRPFDFTDVPNWVKKDPIFAWGVKDGDIRVTETAKEKKAVEKEAAGDPPAETSTDNKTEDPLAGDPSAPEGN
jgi:hypothetical protein